MILLKLFLPFLIYFLAPRIVVLAVPPSASILLITGLSALISIPFLYAVYLRERARTRADEQVDRSGFRRSLVHILVLGAAFCVASNLLINLSGLTKISTTFSKVSEALCNPPLLVQILCTGILIPAAEELIFRGQMYTVLRAKMSWKWAMFISSLFFGLYHMNIVQAIYAFILGLFLAWLRERFGTLFAPWLLHVSANLVSILISILFNSFPALCTLPVILALTGIALGTAAVCWAAIRGKSLS